MIYAINIRLSFHYIIRRCFNVHVAPSLSLVLYFD